jgi:inner membrane protein
MTKPSFLEQHATTLKIMTVLILVLLLLIPVQMIIGLINERNQMQEAAMNDISSKWGASQQIAGPVLSIPYNFFYYDNQKRVVKDTRYLHFLPEQLDVNSKLYPEKRKRGIYEVPVYQADLQFSGKFLFPDVAAFKIDPNQIRWDEASMAVGIPDMRGIREKIEVNLNGQKLDMEPGLLTRDLFRSGAGALIKLDTSGREALTFSFALKIRGSSKLEFVPLGKETKVQLSSSWADPKFNGAFLPEKNEVSTSGFDAEWRIFNLNRNYPQQWEGTQYSFESSAFGVDLLIPLDNYQKTTRTVKYAVMLIGLSFLVFFFLEVLNDIRIHPIQYVFIGLALCLFYTLLLSISEQSNFNIAYGLSGAAVILLVSLYAQAIIKSVKLSLTMFALMFILYGYIFIIIQLEDLALLFGSIGLFIVLAGVMYLSRKIDWYAVRSGRSGEGESQTSRGGR